MNWNPFATIFFLFACVLCHVSIGQAQEAPEKKPVARFTVWGNWSGKEFYIRDPEKPDKAKDAFIKVDLLDLGYSAEVAFSRAQPIELCTPEQVEGETIWQPVIKVAIPADIRQPLVMIMPDEKAEPGIKIYDLDPATFPYGSYQIINMTEMRLFAKLDDTGLLLKPGEHGHFKGTAQSTLNVWLRVAAEKPDKDAQVVYSSMMKNRNDKRMFMFFSTPKDDPDAEVAVRTLVDFAPLPAQP
ncbi:MAG: hypothetical protein ACKO2G_10925 [Verrucomicrobiales bacterium]